MHLSLLTSHCGENDLMQLNPVKLPRFGLFLGPFHMHIQPSVSLPSSIVNVVECSIMRPIYCFKKDNKKHEYENASFWNLYFCKRVVFTH